MESLNEIQTALHEKFDAFAKYIDQEKVENFEPLHQGKWSSGQHLEHLIRSTEPVILALRLPKFLLRLVFGKANRPSKTYIDLVAKYKSRLVNGGVATGRFVPPILRIEEKQKKIGDFLKLKHKLTEMVGKWSENDLDTYILPHPLLGKITIREMLFFTIYHTEHHLGILLKRV